ncbi:MAG: PilN domain-containing protein [Porticoccaceae bacterium]|jgi:type IV pilus assembly protein PilN
MIATINLLPWREEYRQQKKIEFFKIAGLVLIAVLAVVFLWDRIATGNIDNQRARNQLLEEHIAKLENSVQEIAELKERRQQLLDRMMVIQALQANRPDIVRIFDEMASAIPEGVFLSSLNRVAADIALSGYAESNNRVSALMRNLDQSYKFTDPNLTKVLADERLGEQGNTFDMRVKILEPEVVESDSRNNGELAGDKGAQ